MECGSALYFSSIGSQARGSASTAVMSSPSHANQIILTHDGSDPDVGLVPELDAAQDSRRVVHHGDALEHLAEITPVDPRGVAAADVEVVEEGQRIEVGDGLLDPSCSSACRRSSCGRPPRAAR